MTTREGILGKRPEQRAQKLAAAKPVLGHEEVARVAYELYVERGRVDGGDLDDWLKAEAIVRCQENGQPVRRPE